MATSHSEDEIRAMLLAKYQKELEAVGLKPPEATSGYPPNHLRAIQDVSAEAVKSAYAPIPTPSVDYGPSIQGAYKGDMPIWSPPVPGNSETHSPPTTEVAPFVPSFPVESSPTSALDLPLPSVTNPEILPLGYGAQRFLFKDFVIDLSGTTLPISSEQLGDLKIYSAEGFMPRDATQVQHYGCSTTCTPSVSSPVISYTPTDTHYFIPAATDPIVGAKTIQAELTTGLNKVHKALEKQLCGDEVELGNPPPFNSPPACTAVITVGPTLAPLASADADVGVNVAGTKGWYLQTENGKGDPLSSKGKGALTLTLAAQGGVVFKTFGMVQLLAVGASRVRKHPESGGIIDLARWAVDKILDIVKLPEALKEGARRAIKGNMFAETSVEYTAKTAICGGENSATTTTQAVDIHGDDAKEIYSKVKQGPFIKLSTPCPDKNPITIKIETDATASAQATGRYGQTVSLAANLWGLAVLMCCEDQKREDGSTPWKSLFVHAKNTTIPRVIELKEYDEKKVPLPKDFRPLSQFLAAEAAYSTEFNNMVESVKKALKAQAGQNPCDGAKLALEEGFSKLHAIIQQADAGD